MTRSLLAVVWPAVVLTVVLAVMAAVTPLSSAVAQTGSASLASQGDAAQIDALSSEDIWQKLQSQAESQAEDSLWDAAEKATERVFGRKLERKTGETVFQTLEAAADGDWRSALETAGPELLSGYLPGVGQYVDLIKSAAAQIDKVTDRWARQLYDHASYKWVGAQVDARVAKMNSPMLDDNGDPYYGNINDDDEAFMPSYSLPDGSPEKKRARKFEASLFLRFLKQPFYDELVATDWTSNGGGLTGLFTKSYAAMIREELGYQPKPRRLFNHFYHRYTRERLDRYFEVHEYVEAELMRRKAQGKKDRLINAYRSSLKEGAFSAKKVLDAYFDNDHDTVTRALEAGFDPNVMAEYDGHTRPFMFFAGLGLEDVALQPLFDKLVSAGGDVRPALPEDATNLVFHAAAKEDEDYALRVLDAGFPSGVNSVENPSVVLASFISKDMPRVVSRLIEMGHDLNARDGDGATHLMRAIKDRRYNAAEALIDGGADINARKTKAPNPAAIHLVALKNHAEMVPNLASAGAQIDTRLSEKKPFTPLIIAAMQGHFETVRALVDAGADLEIESTSGTAAAYARKKGHDEIADYLASLMYDDPLVAPEIVLENPERGALGQGPVPVELRNIAVKGRVPVKLKSENQQRFVLLKVRGPDGDLVHDEKLEVKYNSNRKPGESREFYRYVELCGHDVRPGGSVCLKSGTYSVTVRHVSGSRAKESAATFVLGDAYAREASNWGIGLALSDKDKPRVRRLLATGLAEPFGTGFTELQEAIKADDGDLTNMVLQVGVDPDTTVKGHSPLLWSLYPANYAPNAARALVAAGADVNFAYTGNGRKLSPLHLAAQKKDLAMVRLLRSRGARITKDDKGRTPGYYIYWLTKDAELAIALGYDEAREYERKANQPGFDWNEFARRMKPTMQQLQQDMTAIQAKRNQQRRETKRKYDAGMRRAHRQARSQSRPYKPSTNSAAQSPSFRGVGRESQLAGRKGSVKTAHARQGKSASKTVKADDEKENPACHMTVKYHIQPMNREVSGGRGKACSEQYNNTVTICGIQMSFKAKSSIHKIVREARKDGWEQKFWVYEGKLASRKKRAECKI